MKFSYSTAFFFSKQMVRRSNRFFFSSVVTARLEEESKKKKKNVLKVFKKYLKENDLLRNAKLSRERVYVES